MRNYRITLRPAQIKRINRFLKNWAKAVQSDDLAQLYLDCVIRGGKGRIVMKGTNSGQ